MAEEIETSEQRRRVIWLASVFAAVGLFLLGRLASWQWVAHPEIKDLGPEGEARPNVISAARGSILDANGHYLVASTVEYKVAVSPALLNDDQKKKLASDLVDIIHTYVEGSLTSGGASNERTLENIIAPGGSRQVASDVDKTSGQEETEEESEREREKARILEVLSQEDIKYVPLGSDLPASVGRQIESLDLDALAIESEFRRVYPDGALAASVLGFLHRYENKGAYGLERYYDRELTGVDGTWYGIRDPWGKQILVSLGGYRPVQDGADLVLTLDRNVQYMAEKVLRQGIEQNKATSGNIIVLNPRTGAILAMANYPTYAPGAYGEVESADWYINTSISALYEPGSVFKPLTLAAGLQARVIRHDSIYDDRGEIIVGDQRIWNSDKRAHGKATMAELLAHSYNVGAAHVATLLGPTRFYEIIRRFGFSEITAIDLAHEARGIMRVPGDPKWHMSDLGTNSFGQGISVTPIQLVAAYAAIANDGVLMRPYVVSEIHPFGTSGAFEMSGASLQSRGTRVQVTEPFRVRRVLSPKVAQQITQLMAEAVELGMKRAIVPGYRFAGKSGTSGIPTREGYGGRDTIASFAGFGPIEDPRFVILVKFDKPREGRWGLEVAAPEFRKMAELLVDYYSIESTVGY